MRSYDFSVKLVFAAAFWAIVDSAYDGNEYEESSWVLRAAGA
jgi:hypothetical protein